MKSIASIAVALLFFAATAKAQSTGDPALDYLVASAGTIETASKPQFSEGELFGCMIQFTALARDTLRKSGVVKVGGLVGILTSRERDRYSVVLQLTVMDIVPTSSSLKERPITPYSAHFVSGVKSSKPYLIRTKPPDEPGKLFAVFNIDGGFETLMDGIRKERIDIVFNKSANDVDLVIPIDLTVERTEQDARVRSNKTIEGFRECGSNIFSAKR